MQIQLLVFKLCLCMRTDPVPLVKTKPHAKFHPKSSSTLSYIGNKTNWSGYRIQIWITTNKVLSLSLGHTQESIKSHPAPGAMFVVMVLKCKQTLKKKGGRRSRPIHIEEMCELMNWHPPTNTLHFACVFVSQTELSSQISRKINCALPT